MTEQFKFTPAEIEQINALEHHAMSDTLSRVLPKIEQVLAPRWAREAERVRELEKILTAASHALRSYQYGNSSEELAESMADTIDAALKGREQ